MAFRVIHGPTYRFPDDRVTVEIQSGHHEVSKLDMLAITSTAADIPRLITLLRQAQAERDALVSENLKLESQLTQMSIAIHTAQQEDRAPIWPPAR